MKKFFVTIVLATFFGFTHSAPAELQDVKVGQEPTLKISGWTQASYAETTTSSDEFQWNNLRLKADWSSERWEASTQVNLPFNDGQIDSNWLREVWVKYKVNDNWSLKAGRIFLAAGNSTPDAYSLRTVAYPSSMTFPCYAYGAQVEGQLSESVSLVFDVTGRSGLAFDDDHSFDRIELSAMLRQQFGEKGKPGSGNIAGYTQLCQDFQRFGVSTAWQPDNHWNLMGALCYTRYESIEVSDQFGGYVQVAYRATPWLELHSQVDYLGDISKTYEETNTKFDRESGQFKTETVEIQTSDAKRVYWTNGVRLMDKKDRCSLTLDYETVVDGPEDNRLLAKAQFKF